MVTLVTEVTMPNIATKMIYSSNNLTDLLLLQEEPTLPMATDIAIVTTVTIVTSKNNQMEKTMNYNTKKVQIIHEYGSNRDCPFIEFRDLSDNKIKILKTENFLKRYSNIQIKNRRK